MFFSYIDYYWNKFYRTEHLKKNNLYFPENMFWLSDARFNLNVLKTLPRISIVSTVGTVFTVGHESTTSNWKIGLKEEFLDYGYGWENYLSKFVPEDIVLDSMVHFMPCINDFNKLANAKNSEKDIIYELITWLEDGRELYQKLLKAANYDRKYLNNIEMTMMKLKAEFGVMEREESIFLKYYNRYMFKEDSEKYLQELLQLIWHEDNIFSLGVQELTDMIL